MTSEGASSNSDCTPPPVFHSFALINMPTWQQKQGANFRTRLEKMDAEIKCLLQERDSITQQQHCMQKFVLLSVDRRPCADSADRELDRAFVFRNIELLVLTPSSLKRFLDWDMFDVNRTPRKCAHRLTVELSTPEWWFSSSYGEAVDYLDTLLDTTRPTGTQIHFAVKGKIEAATGFDVAIVPSMCAAKEKGMRVSVTHGSGHIFDFERPRE
ncbi:hypothetical protein EJ02DRAFT_435640 [Clathrospora elynae]|uniref:Uncharacterized protein n=1 Tax=Clathrospora elynae TaxID=706981 RepID=A0A6A5SP42_9PLEO|nr:hypothetical protein EJ02DRAFT_435640 [Clathrospora elynae]